VLDRATFAQVRTLLEADDRAGLDKLFGRDQPKVSPDRPNQYGGGRLELTFPADVRPVRATLDLQSARVTVELRRGQATHHLTIGQHPTDEVTWIDCDAPQLLAQTTVTLTPAFETVRESLAERGVPAPDVWTNPTGGGFLQRLPQDDPLAIAWRRLGTQVLLASALGPDARAVAERRAGDARVDHVRRDADAWWAGYWKAVPQIRLPDAELQRFVDLGLYKQAGLNPPHAIAATLQGCWMEDYQIPPWSNDYHFNINVQLVYSACLPTNRPEHMGPLWSMVKAWFPKLRETGERFFGRPGAMMLPHAVDDRCNVVGTFWAGTIDHACTAWVAQMAWLHYRHTMDEAVLRDIAWPLLIGAFEGFWAMIEHKDDGTLSLPVSVSPEYHRDDSMAGQWGRDASFQLAAAHMTARLLQRAARALGRDADPNWQALLDGLPPYAAVDQPQRANQRRISLWDGHDLTKSHRHHSHLASIWPFRTVDPFDPQHNRTVANAIGHWGWLGAGEWTGWCVPWASMIYARLGLANAALLWLKWWSFAFANEGYGTLHNAHFTGASVFSDGALGRPDFRPDTSQLWEVMQIDAAMAVVTAVCELLVQCRWATTTGGADEPVLHVLPAGLPKGWRELEFDGVLVEGAFLVGATVRDAAIQQVRITSLKGQPLALAAGGLAGYTLDGAVLDAAQPVFRTPTASGQTIVLERPSTPAFSG
jgi:hypothetical protein